MDSRIDFFGLNGLDCVDLDIKHTTESNQIQNFKI